MPYLVAKRGVKRYQANVMVKGIRRQKLFPDRSRRSLADAIEWEEQEAARIRHRLETGTAYLDIEKWADEYLDFAEKEFVKKTFEGKQAACRRFSEHSGIQPDDPIDAMARVVCRAFLKKQNLARGGNAANKDRKNLAAGWNWGKDNYEEDWPEIPNPFEAVKKFKEKRHPRYIPPEDDFWAAYSVTVDQDRVMLLAYLHLAARKRELFRLTRSDLDFSNSRVRLWTRKRKDGQLDYDWLPMTTELEAALRWWVKELVEIPDWDGEHVFINLNPNKPNLPYYGTAFRQRRAFTQRLCKQASVRYFDYHAIRHLTAIILYKAGYSVGHIQTVLRHKNPTTTERYLKRLGLELVRDPMETGLRLPARVISFKPLKTEKTSKTANF